MHNIFKHLSLVLPKTTASPNSYHIKTSFAWAHENLAKHETNGRNFCITDNKSYTSNMWKSAGSFALWDWNDEPHPPLLVTVSDGWLPVFPVRAASVASSRLMVTSPPPSDSWLAAWIRSWINFPSAFSMRTLYNRYIYSRYLTVSFKRALYISQAIMFLNILPPLLFYQN